MRALIAGLGSIGRRHLANLRTLEPDAHIVVWRPTAAESAPQDAPLADDIVYSLEDALRARPDVVLVTSPASSHVRIASAFVAEGAHVFIEKPLSHDLCGVEPMLDQCRQRGLVLMVGYHMRFYAPLEALRRAVVDGRIGRPLFIRAEVGQYLPDWRPATDYRRSPTARADQGGGVVLELSHEIDYVRWLAGDVRSVHATTARLGDLDIDVEDTAEILLRFDNGTLGSVHLDMIQRAPSRSCRVAGSLGTLTWDRSSHHVRFFSADDDGWSDVYGPADVDPNDPYVAELRHFLDCISTGSAPRVTGEDGLAALRIALAVKESAACRRAVDL